MGHVGFNSETVEYAVATIHTFPETVTSERLTDVLLCLSSYFL
jgi:hypothetical protein